MHLKTKIGDDVKIEERPLMAFGKLAVIAVVLVALTSVFLWLLFGLLTVLSSFLGSLGFVIAAVAALIIIRSVPRLLGSWSIFHDEGICKNGHRRLSVDFSRGSFEKRFGR
jgi:hypothetical protein